MLASSSASCVLFLDTGAAGTHKSSNRHMGLDGTHATFSEEHDSCIGQLLRRSSRSTTKQFSLAG